MRISATHATVYRYEAPVQLDPHLIRLRPRDDGAQRLVSHTLSIYPPPAGQSAFTDQDGNYVVQAWFAGLVREMTVRSAFAIDTLRENPFDFLLPSAREMDLPLRLPEELRPSLAPYLEGAAGGEEIAARAVEAAGRQLMPFLDRLTSMLFTGFRQVLRRQGPPCSARETVASGEGSCRDLAVLFCAAARAAGIPARFVSGYEIASAFEEPAYMHAWAEVYIPTGGWRGFDPSRGLAVSNSHVAVAAAADPAMAAPVTGAYRGPVRSTMDFDIQMQAGG